MGIQKKSDHSLKNLWKWTISAQLHGVMALLSLPAGWWLIVQVAPQGKLWALLVTVYAVASTFVFSASTFYHFISDGFECDKKIECWLNRIDHISIV
jgi:channel protein (hemolysin III family)